MNQPQNERPLPEATMPSSRASPIQSSGTIMLVLQLHDFGNRNLSDEMVSRLVESDKRVVSGRAGR